MANVGVTINANNTISVDSDPVTVKAGDTITWKVTDNSTNGVTVNFDSWQLVSGTSSFASPFSKTANPVFAATASPGGTGATTSGPVTADSDTTWSYTVALSGKGISIDPRVVISGSFDGEEVKSREVY